MNILIAGGFLLIGIVALIAVILLFMAEGRTRKENLQATTRDAQLKQEKPADSVMEVTGTLGPELPPLPSLNDQEQMQANLNGQFHEMVAEIQALHQQVKNFEQRLSHVAGMLDTIEQNAEQQRVKIHEESEAQDEA